MASSRASGATSPTRLTDGGRDAPSGIIFSQGRLIFLSIVYVGQGMVRSLVPGEAIVSLAEEQNFEKYNALALDETSVYWGVADSIRSVSQGGGEAVTVASSLKNPRSFALDPVAIYWTEDDGGIWRAPKRPAP